MHKVTRHGEGNAVWTVEFDVTAEHDGTSDDLKALLLVAYGVLRKDGSVVTPQMWAALAENRVTFKAITRDESREDATRCATAAVRCALHAAGGSTPGWEEQTERLIAALENSRVVSERVVPVSA